MDWVLVLLWTAALGVCLGVTFFTELPDWKLNALLALVSASVLAGLWVCNGQPM